MLTIILAALALTPPSATLSTESVTLNKARLFVPTTPKHLHKILGKPDRIEPLLNQIHVWGKLEIAENVRIFLLRRI